MSQSGKLCGCAKSGKKAAGNSGRGVRAGGQSGRDGGIRRGTESSGCGTGNMGCGCNAVEPKKAPQKTTSKPNK